MGPGRFIALRPFVCPGEKKSSRYAAPRCSPPPLRYGGVCLRRDVYNNNDDAGFEKARQARLGRRLFVKLKLGAFPSTLATPQIDRLLTLSRSGQSGKHFPATACPAWWGFFDLRRGYAHF
jgi:hypothetical protein